jgi:signal transduction histidine kinase/ActR/RegA family two-component response regulator
MRRSRLRCPLAAARGVALGGRSTARRLAIAWPRSHITPVQVAMQHGEAEPESNKPWLEGGGEAGAVARSLDWSMTPLGPVESWPSSLKAIVGVMLKSRHPMFLWWGPELVQIYNDAYVPSFGAGKHPAAMGQRGADCWPEIWPIIYPQIDDVMTRAKASWNEDHLVPVRRGNRLEEVYWTYGYSPVFADARTVGGTLVICAETTARTLAERRHRALRSLARATALATTVPAVLCAASELFEETPSDVPFAMIYLTEKVTGDLVLWRTVGLGRAEQVAVDAACRPELAAAAGRAPIRLPPEALGVSLSGGPWPEPSTSAFVAPLGDGRNAQTTGFLVLGLSPRLPFNASYRDHLLQIAEHLGLVLARIETYRLREASAVERDDLLRELEAANQAKDEFLAMLGHELRNPLSPIVTALDLWKRREDGRTNREQDIIERQVGHLVRLVDDLLDVSKITRGKIVLRKEPLEIAGAVAKAAEIASDLFEQHRHRLTIDVPAEGLCLEGDPVRLAQVFANLLTNAARYTEPGGTISIRASREGSDIVVVVADSGMGIAPELLPRIFDHFVQGWRSTDRKEGGLGLGLALVKSLVALHGGAAAARSEGPGKGSEFEIRLPATRTAEQSPRASPAQTSQGAADPKRILVVDDNEDSAELLREMLRWAGHDVEVAHDGPSALAMVDDFAPDVAVLDIGLPVMDGYELGRRLHERPPAAKCRLIALSGYGQERDRAQSKASGFEAHLVKPVDARRLLKVVAGEGDLSLGAR